MKNLSLYLITPTCHGISRLTGLRRNTNISEQNKLETTEKIIIVGGGAAGLMAGLRATELGAGVVILEKMDCTGRKLAITGKGRCNLTTGQSIKTSIEKFGPNGRFLHSAFSRFFSRELISVFVQLGVPVALERGKRYFPLSGKARDVVEALSKRIEDLSGEIVTGSRVNNIRRSGNRLEIETQSGGYSSPRVIIATGGLSYPGTGSTGDGYRIAGALGHSIVKPSPALVPIVLQGEIPAMLAPLSFNNIKLTLIRDGKVLGEEFGDALFTEWGITGPAALPLGTIAAKELAAGPMKLIVNFKPALTEEQLDARLRREFDAAGARLIENIMPNLLPRRAAEAIIQISGIPLFRKGCEITKPQREQLLELLMNLTFDVTGVRPIEEAIVTAGGVALDEVNPKTMESKIVPGLHICGELLDLDAGTGGFNLQCAFSTGWAAGEAAARALGCQ